MAAPDVQVIQYLVDTRSLFPRVKKTAELENDASASHALTFLTSEEKAKVLKYFFVADAKMALTSHLLKHWVISRYCDVPWSQTKLSRDTHGKPIYVDNATTGHQPIVFNVSHQAGLVSLVAVHGYKGAGPVDVGTDIVCTSERRDRDHKAINDKGWADYVSTYSDVFGRSETAYLKAGHFPPRPSPANATSGASDTAATSPASAVVDYKLRCFYTLWCLREGYVKMTGEALLAEWLKDLEFRDFGAPAPQPPGTAFRQRDDEPAEVLPGPEVWFHGKRVTGEANISLRSLGPDYMTCSAVRTPADKDQACGWTLGPYKFLPFDEILADAEDAGGP